MASSAEPDPVSSALAAELIDAARRRGLRVATAESCTGGLLAGAITDVPGASEVFERGFVAYSNESKRELLGVPAPLIAAEGAVSAAVAARMAEGALDASRADCAASVTGIAGPGGSPFKPVGLVFVGAARRGARPEVQKLELGALGRSAVRRRSVEQALRRLLAQVLAAR